MNCPKCNKPVKAGAKFCSSCGASLVKKCKKCKREMEYGERYCSHCGFDNEKEEVSGSKKVSKNSGYFFNIRRIGALIEAIVTIFIILSFYAANSSLAYTSLFFIDLFIVVLALISGWKIYGWFLIIGKTILWILSAIGSISVYKDYGIDSQIINIPVMIAMYIGPIFMCLTGRREKKAAAKAEHERELKLFWTCPSCGSSNPKTTSICQNCCYHNSEIE